VLNKVILMGRLVADPELKQTTSNISVCRFSIAINRPFVPKGGGERQSDFVNIVVWRNTAEFVSRYFSKGKMIIVEGALRNNNYTDSNGIKHYSLEVHADNVSFGESKNASSSGGESFSEPPSYKQENKQQPSNESLQIGDLGDFEEILSDGDVPF